MTPETTPEFDTCLKKASGPGSWLEVAFMVPDISHSVMEGKFDDAAYYVGKVRYVLETGKRIPGYEANDYRGLLSGIENSLKGITREEYMVSSEKLQKVEDQIKHAGGIAVRKSYETFLSCIATGAKK